MVLDASTKGRKSAGGAVELQGLVVVAKKHLREAHSKTDTFRDLQFQPLDLAWHRLSPSSSECLSRVQDAKPLPLQAAIPRSPGIMD
jgi:hypothetical protein